MGHAQILNTNGHLIPAEPIARALAFSHQENGTEVQVNGLTLKGNAAFALKEGYLTLSGNYENAPAIIRQYDATGKCVFQKEYRQTINFCFDPAKAFCAFHDMDQIHVLNLQTHEEFAVEGTQMFALHHNGKLASYHEAEKKVYVGKQGVPIQEPVYRCLFFRDDAIFATRTRLVSCLKGEIKTIFTAPAGRIFDMDVFNNNLYISTKEESPTAFTFTSYYSTDGTHFQKNQVVQCPRNLALKHSNSRQPKKTTVLTNETFPNPLHYSEDSVYQEIGNSYFELQDYGPGYPYPHPGVDIMGVNQQPVFAVKKGYVQGVLTTSGEFHWRIALARNPPPGYSQGYLYAHLEESSMPFTYGDSVEAGEQIGVLANFPVDGFVHCHFARIGGTGQFWEGNWTTFDDPLVYMDNFYDSIPPEFEKTMGNKAFAFRRHHDGQYLSEDSLYGNVSVISKFHDKINSILWKSDVHRVRYQVSPVSSPNILLLDSAAFEYHYSCDFYFYGPTFRPMVNLIYSRDSILYSQGDYQNRNFYHKVVNTNGDDTLNYLDSLHSFHTADLPDGDYIFRILAWDAAENHARDSMQIRIKNLPTHTLAGYSSSGILAWPNPATDRIQIRSANGAQSVEYVIWNQTGSLIQSSGLNLARKGEIEVQHLPQGLYFMQITDDQGRSQTLKFMKQD